MSNQRPISEWVDFLTKYAEEITFEGCGYKLVSPEDADEIAVELEALRADAERYRKWRHEFREGSCGLWNALCEANSDAEHDAAIDAAIDAARAGGEG